MLSLPDFKEKQLLFIRTEPGAKNWLKFENDNIVYCKGDQVVNRASCHRVFAVFVVGDCSITSGLMREGKRCGVSLFLLKNNFELYATIGASADGHYILRERQYARTPDQEFALAKLLIKNKIANQSRLLKERKLEDGLLKEKKSTLNSVLEAKTPEVLLGIEGNASRKFFGEYFAVIDWKRRSPRTKQDIPNFLLDIGYTMLFNCMDSLLRLYGFDTFKGFYHKQFFQRKSLSCDMVEPFRCLIDKQLVKSCNLGQIDANDFKFKDGKYSLHYVKSRKYSEIFMEVIMQNREAMYKMVRSLYKATMLEDTTQFSGFKIKVWS